MHKIAVYSIMKKEEKCYKEIAQDFTKMSRKFADIKTFDIFSKKIGSAQTKGEDEAKAAYTQALEPYIKSGLNIALDPKGEVLNSEEFSSFFEKSQTINFFIGGAYGFEKKFLEKCDKIISLSKMTFSHKLAKIVLLEQIYRGLSIVNAHPYHK
ncbi:23S rRNA (pseudouridine(1915)-N(3))-methyltransferase RlmH [Nitrosophilus alvini]|uniref:23S rRNA (pseudouridine(1915)-N(3))-methyltransferase RlmH n=1 Tax=Nitrosophilus alvini TaxID=2714855 RepID=UPI00190BF518|nr:23S rRNA (pseudouridine(1915)-N(3))-methyltransferase RlmH [Nitrosophilus alvini]